MPTFRIEITCSDIKNDSEGRDILHSVHDYGFKGVKEVYSVRVYTISGDFQAKDAVRAGREFLSDAVVDKFTIDEPVLSPALGVASETMRKVGVMDPAEESVKKGLKEIGINADWVKNSKKYIFVGDITTENLEDVKYRLLGNEVIEEVEIGHNVEVKAPANSHYIFKKQDMNLDGLSDDELLKLSTDKQLYMSLPEMKEAQKYFKELGRTPTDIEMETIAQTWSEHCVHKTFKGVVNYQNKDTGESEVIDNLLKETVAKVTKELDKEWCWSVFVDNSGVIEFDGEMGAAFKVETHNHPSAIEPYGGAGTGIGGCIRDPMGTGLGGKPVMNTDVFCFGLPDTPREDVPKGSLHPLRIMKGVVGGVRDYGNRMGIPTTNGAVFYDYRYTGNPLVFCGNIAMIPKDKAEKRFPTPGQLAIVIGGGTGRDGIHGATFSSVELDEESEMVSSGAVQIGNPIEEKKVLDFLLRARDAGLYTCLTDCGAGGLSSAIGEMGETCGVEVDLDKVPLKYEGLNYTEIWISEAQERMVISTDENCLQALLELAEEENVSITPIAKFRDDKKLILRYEGEVVADMDMDFLHDGCPRITREAVWQTTLNETPEKKLQDSYNSELSSILGAWNVCSKEWIIRQYDHEVQGNSVVKPLVGAEHDGPGDAAVIAPIFGSKKALVVSNGLNPKFSDIDPYWMAASAIDEAVRNIIATGGSIDRCAILDNFCWGNCDKPDRLAGLVRAAKACYDFGTVYGLPFVSGKDSLNNEYGVGDETICIPGTLLISAMSVMDDLDQAVTMDLKDDGNTIYIVGKTYNELGASHYYALEEKVGNNVPKVRPEESLKTYAALAECSKSGLARAMHDCSEGGLAAAIAEMAFAGNRGVDIDLSKMPVDSIDVDDSPAQLFSESNSRIIVEVKPENEAKFAEIMQKNNAIFAKIGIVNTGSTVNIKNMAGNEVINANYKELKSAWQTPLAL